MSIHITMPGSEASRSAPVPDSTPDSPAVLLQPGPFQEAGPYVVQDHRGFYASFAGSGKAQAKRRAVACLNACEGFTTEDLEDGRNRLLLAVGNNVSVLVPESRLAALREAPSRLAACVALMQEIELHARGYGREAEELLDNPDFKGRFSGALSGAELALESLEALGEVAILEVGVSESVQDESGPGGDQ